jgi:hypothetical protein
MLRTSSKKTEYSGERHEVPAHYNAKAYVGAYMSARPLHCREFRCKARLGPGFKSSRQKKSPLCNNGTAGNVAEVIRKRSLSERIALPLYLRHRIGAFYINLRA